MLLLLCLFLEGQSYAQQNNIDSLLNEFKHTSNVDLRTYDQLFIALYPEYMEELVLVAEDLLTQSIRTKNMNGMHRAADAFGVYFTQKGYFNQAFKILYRSMRYYERTDNQAYLMKAYHYLGSLFLSWGNEEEAIYYFSNLLKIAENSPNQNALYTGRNNLALAYFQNKRYDLGIIQLRQNEADAKFLNYECAAITNNLIGNYYLNKEMLDSAKFKYLKSIDYASKNSDNRLISTAYANLGICEFGDNPEKSMQLFEDSYQYALNSTSIERISVSLFNIASWHLEFEDRKMALKYYQQSYEVAASANSYVNMYDALDEIAEIYRSQDNWILVDSINQIIRGIKSEQHGEFIDLSNDEALLENAFSQYTPLASSSSNAQSGFALSNRVLISSLLFLLLIQFITIIYLSLRLARKH